VPGAIAVVIYIYIVSGSFVYNGEPAAVWIYRCPFYIFYVTFIEYDHLGRQYKNGEAVDSLVAEKAPCRAYHKNDY
jgi:hypothetical protein